MTKLKVKTGNREELYNITSEVQSAVDRSGVSDGICHIFVPHTTAAVLIQEADDPAVGRDIATHLRRLFPRGDPYEHNDGNADAHMKATGVGNTATVFIEKGKLTLGTWQGIFFCEFDGPRAREVWVRVQG
ncbi:MAG: secondary thiamine-phosphate synthase enzyme YjbQ [Candidatus Methylomirabilales bacterium]|jgi:secondary thiamine-phosphate synthase enzyme|nr:YjbQ family protein [candidate division NC10 bacterium]MCZ6552064.1 secondary thiamine-phosphate synthase enzyme YjbQ [candidate division NC10 bacterium]